MEALVTAHPGAHAMFLNTLNVTMINAGIKANVIPAKSEATIDLSIAAWSGTVRTGVGR